MALFTYRFYTSMVLPGMPSNALNRDLFGIGLNELAEKAKANLLFREAEPGRRSVNFKVRITDLSSFGNAWARSDYSGNIWFGTNHTWAEKNIKGGAEHEATHILLHKGNELHNWSYAQKYAALRKKYGTKVPNKMTRQQVVDAFQNTPEFKKFLATATKEEFITALYRGLLGREPEPAGLKYWVEKLDG